MSDHLLSLNDREEALSLAYTAAVAAIAGYVTSKQDFDRDSVYIQIRAGGAMRPSLDIQLKATAYLGDADSSGILRYALKRRNYDLLIQPVQVPRVLVVLSLPSEEAQWLNITVEQLVIRNCAYWASLAGFPETDNTASVTVPIPTSNQFDVGGLKALMAKARSGSLV